MLLRRVVAVTGAILVSLILAGRAGAGVNVWTSTGPEGGIVDAVAIDPLTPSTLYAAAGFGVFKSTDGGGGWALANTGIPTSVRALAVDPRTPTTLYAATSVAGVFKSTDGAATWAPMNTGLTTLFTTELAIDPGTPAALYVGTIGGGVFKTTNGGLSWAAANTGLTDLFIAALAIDPGTPLTLYAGTAGGVFKSTNGGAGWSPINSGLTNLSVTALVIDPVTPATLYAGTAGGGVFRLTGVTPWTPVNGGLTDLSVTALAIDPVTPTTLYAGTSGGGVFKSTTLIPSWAPANTGLTDLRGRVLAVDPQTPATLYAGTNAGVFQSGNRAASWIAANGGLIATDTPALAVDPGTPTTVYAATGSGAVKSANGGITWAAINTGLTATSLTALAIDPLTPATLYTGTLNGGVFKTATAGASWGPINTGLTDLVPNPFVTALAIDPTTPTTLYVATESGGVIDRLHKSTNGGGSWVLMNAGLPGNQFISALAIDPATPATLYAGTSLGVFKSTNGAAGWGPASAGLTNTPVRALVIDPVTPATLYAGTAGGVFRSTDRGATWAPASVGLANTSIKSLAIDPVTPTTLYAGTSGGGVFKSTDGAASWAPLSAGLASLTVQALAIDPDTPTRIYAGTKLGVSSIDQGSLVLTVQVAGTGTVTSMPSGISCDADCSEAYPAGTVVVLTATAGPGVVFTGWSGGGCAGTGPCVVRVGAALTLTATFAAPSGPPPGLVVSPASAGLGGFPANGESQNPAVSADGRFVAFGSTATNMVARACTTGVRQIHRRDRLTGELLCVSQASGVPGNGPSSGPAISADGRFVAYESMATSLAPGCGGGIPQILRTDVVTGETACVSQSGGVAGNGPSGAPAISADGRFVAFDSIATNLAAACATGVRQVLRRDLSGGIDCVSTGPGGAAGNGASAAPAISADGRVVAFQSLATNLGPGACVSGVQQIVVRDAGVTSCASVGPGAVAGNGPSGSVAMSADASVVAFESTATNLDPACLTGVQQIYVRSGGTTRCVSRGPGGVPGDGPSSGPTVSGNGLVLAFATEARNLVGPPSAAAARAIVAQGAGLAQIIRANTNVQGAVADLLSQSGGAAGNGSSVRPTLSFDGSVTAFESAATNLTSGDTNGRSDVLTVEASARVRITTPLNGTQFPLTVPTAVTFAWTALPGVTQYGFEFTGPNRGFANPNGAGPDPVNGFGGAGGGVLISGTGFTTAIAPSFPPGNYQLRVIGLSPAGQPVGSFSDAITLILGPVFIPPGARPTITTPATGATVTRDTPVVFVWTVVPGVAQYLVEATRPGRAFVNPNGTVPDPVNALGSVVVLATALPVVIPPGLAPGAYGVRVIGLTTAGDPAGSFSDAVTVVVAP